MEDDERDYARCYCGALVAVPHLECREDLAPLLHRNDER